jgi:tripartite ATP-independent transporter DctM subunit
LTGGLAMAVVSAAALFAACTGSSIASAATMANICYPELRKFGYDKGFAAGLVASSGSLAALIPPSVIMVIYCMLTDSSLARLMVAGFLPGAVSVVVWMSVIYIVVKRNPLLAPNKEKFPWKEKFRVVPKISGIVLIVIFVIGGMYIGIFTATEAAAAGALLTLTMAAARNMLSFSILRGSLTMTSLTTASIFFIVFGALIFGKFLSLSGLTRYAIELVTAASLPPLVVFIGVFVLYLFLGCILEAASMLAVSLPLVFPMMLALGFDPIWFGIMIVKMTEMAVITPPVGLNVYAVSGVLKDEISLESIFANIIPFLIGDVIIIAILYIFPQIALFLPSQFIGS